MLHATMHLFFRLISFLSFYFYFRLVASRGPVHLVRRLDLDHAEAQVRVAEPPDEPDLAAARTLRPRNKSADVRDGYPVAALEVDGDYLRLKRAILPAQVHFSSLVILY